MLEIVVAFFLGYKSANLLTKPESIIAKKIPFLQLGFIQILPSIRIYIKGKIIHIHHWLHLSVLFILSFNYHPPLVDPTVFKGILVGWIMQGFSYPDWNRFILDKRKESDLHSLVK